MRLIEPAMTQCAANPREAISPLQKLPFGVCSGRPIVYLGGYNSIRVRNNPSRGYFEMLLEFGSFDLGQRQPNSKFVV